MEYKEIVALVFGILIGITMIAELISIIFQNSILRAIFKAIPLFLIEVFFLVYDYQSYYLLAITAFLYSLGDIFLLGSNKKLFFIGSLCFFNGHIAALIHFNLFFYDKFNVSSMIIALIISIFALILISIRLKRRLREFVVGAFCYLEILLYLAIYNFSIIFINNYNYLYLFITLGYLIYFISDLLVIRKRFIKKNQYSDFLIMFTYYLANLIVFSFLLL